MTQLLCDIAYVRSGDKGDTATIGVLAKSPAAYPAVVSSITEDRVRALFGDWVKGAIEIYQMDNIHGVVVHMHAALGGGATKTLRLDQTGKALGSAILRLPVASGETCRR